MSLFPIGIFAPGAYRNWPIRIDCLVFLCVIAIGYFLHDANVHLAGWLGFRCGLVFWLLGHAIRRSEPRDRASTLLRGVGGAISAGGACSGGCA